MGRSSSRSSTAQTQTSTNLVNDGEFAGASNISIDESDRSTRIEDVGNTDIENDLENVGNTDNSIDFRDVGNTDIDNDIDNSVEQDIDNSIEQDIRNDIDNSVTNDIDNSVDIENEGSFSGNSGVINVLDGGAINAAQQISFDANDAIRATAELAITSTENQLDSAFEFGGDVISDLRGLAQSTNQSLVDNNLDNLEFSETVIGDFSELADENSLRLLQSNQSALSFGREALDDVADIARSTSDDLRESNDNVLRFTQSALESAENQLSTFTNGLEENAEAFAEQLAFISNQAGASNQQILTTLAEQNTENAAVLAGFAESASTGGQSVVANSSVQIIQAIALAIGVGFVAL